MGFRLVVTPPVMNQDLKSFMLVFMRGQQQEKKYMVIDKENGGKEKI